MQSEKWWRLLQAVPCSYLTESNIAAARYLYKSAGFRLVLKRPHHSWGRSLLAETWELKLQSGS